MLAITVELLHGLVRAGSADDIAVTGLADPGEWPLSPARVFSALVAGDGTGARSRGTDGTELRHLEVAGAPTIRADAVTEVEFSALRPRFVVLDEKSKKGAVQNYPAREARAVQPGTRMSPRNPRLCYLWADYEPSDAALAGLRYRANRVGYIGCADSPARVRIDTVVPADFDELPEWLPAEDGAYVLPVPYDGFLADLDRSFEQFSSGVMVRRSWIASPRQSYRDPGTLADDDAPRPTVFWLRLTHPVAARRVLAVTATLREAVLAHFGEDAPAVLHGHANPGDHGYEQARFLALAEVGGDHSSGRIRGAAVWLPPECDPDVVAGVAAALRSTSRLYNGASLDVGLSVFDGTRWPWASNPARWRGPSRHWVSVFPVVFERHPKGTPTLDEVARWCEHAGLPRPVAYRVSNVPLVNGAAALEPGQMFRPGKPRGPFAHMELWFDSAIEGPVVLGRARQLGLGLMAPVDESVPGAS